jgi:formylglycine-generating enzyme required for sulfatase activity
MSQRTWFLLVLLSGLLIGLGFVLPGWTAAPKGKKYALLVGVTEYDSKNFATLKYTGNDAEQMTLALRKAGFAVRVLTNKRGEKDAKDAPTAANIRAELEKLLENKTKHDTVLVGLAGHGVQLDVTDPDEKGKEKQYLYFCPKDASKQGIRYKSGRSKKLILLDELFEQMGRCDAGHKLALIDACRNEGRVKAGERRIDAKKVTIPDGVAALFSCGRGQTAWETSKLGDGHGVFFYYVIQGLKGKAKNDEGGVTWDSLTDYVKRQVSRQVPELIGGGARQSPASMGNLEGESPALARIVKDTRNKDKTVKDEVVKKAAPGKGGKTSIEMAFKRIPRGKFLMGSPGRSEPFWDTDRSNDEKQHEVQISKDFYMGVYEVTQKQFKAVMGYNPSYFSTDGKGKEGVDYGKDKPGGGKHKVKGLDTDDFPVENVSYDEAVKFTEELTRREKKTLGGWKYSLPTEAQWEYACRGGATSYKTFHFGNSDSYKLANYELNLGRTEKVGSYGANGYGLKDMHGNVEEWCLDWYDKDYYARSPRSDPLGPSEGSLRVSRGGDWFIGFMCCRVAARGKSTPSSRSSRRGFRVARVPAR